MGWNKIKKMFKKKRKRDQVVTYDGGEIGLKDIGYPLIMEEENDVPHNMKIHTKYIGTVDTPKGSRQVHRWEINGVMINATTLIDAQRKYLRQRKDT